ncbi:MAG: adenylate/guanylate cyclase domain-containing protein [Acidimicrobiia bacterium]
MPRLRSWWEEVLSSGEYPGETDTQRGKRRILVGYILIGLPPRLFFAASEFAEGLTAVGVVDLVAGLLPVGALLVLRAQPHWFEPIVNILLLSLLLENLVPTVLLGGLVPSALLIVFGLLAVVGALMMLSRRAAFLWLVAYLVAVVLSVVLPEVIDPRYEVEAAAGDIAGVIAATTLLLYAGMAYFVRQRDRFQQESDDLLHNILPDDIARRLKSEKAMIADHYDSVSVLFADVVNFTPMSAGMSPAQLVGLLNSVFTTFDGFVEELGLEKIKTVGDEYMVAAGVPRERPDHAHALAELALRIRDHTHESRFDGHAISLRIGINSGPVVAGIVGTHKFAYDLWGDTVNTASRMESEGLAGEIQLSTATYELIRDEFECRPRGVINVKGKGEMTTYLLVARADTGRDPR